MAQLTVQHNSFFKRIDWQTLQEKPVKPPEKERVAKNTKEYNQAQQGAKGG
jgi:hypothetical protein